MKKNIKKERKNLFSSITNNSNKIWKKFSYMIITSGIQCRRSFEKKEKKSFQLDAMKKNIKKKKEREKNIFSWIQ